MRVLVTGAAGFIGSTLSDRLLADGHQVTAVDNFDPHYGRAVKERNAAGLFAHPSARFVECDLTRDELGGLLEGVEAVVHLAAQASVRRSWGTDFAPYVAANVLATQRLLEASRHVPLAAWVYASSASVYGNEALEPVDETYLPTPHSPYGVTKLAGEHLAHLYRRSYGVPTLALRFFSVYGPRERPDKAIQIFLTAARDSRDITLFGDGSQTRDFTYVDDAVAATVEALRRAPVGETLNIARGETVPLSRVIAAIREITGRPLTVHHAHAELGDVRVTAARIDRAVRVLGYAPATGLEEGLRRQWARILLEGEDPTAR